MMKIDIELCPNLWYNRHINQRLAPSPPLSEFMVVH